MKKIFLLVACALFLSGQADAQSFTSSWKGVKPAPVAKPVVWSCREMTSEAAGEGFRWGAFDKSVDVELKPVHPSQTKAYSGGTITNATGNRPPDSLLNAHLYDVDDLQSVRLAFDAEDEQGWDIGPEKALFRYQWMDLNTGQRFPIQVREIAKDPSNGSYEFIVDNNEVNAAKSRLTPAGSRYQWSLVVEFCAESPDQRLLWTSPTEFSFMTQTVNGQWPSSQPLPGGAPSVRFHGGSMIHHPIQ